MRSTEQWAAANRHMTTQAYFENIEAQILRELDHAKESVIVAVAWLTNAPLFNKLCEKCGHGVIVQLMVLDDDINNTSANDFSRLEILLPDLGCASIPRENPLLMRFQRIAKFLSFSGNAQSAWM